MISRTSRISLYIVGAAVIAAGLHFFFTHKQNQLGVKGNKMTNSSYMLGYSMGASYRVNKMQVNYNALIKGIYDGIHNDSKLANTKTMKVAWGESLQAHKKAKPH